MHRHYGFKFDATRNVTLCDSEVQAIKLIFAEYLNGLSLGGICEKLEQCGYISPAGKAQWSRSSVDNILTKGYYVPAIISFEEFATIQFERQARSNTIEETGKRKTTRYHSKNELSGLFICHECGAAYRRITRHSGEVVWRCASRVEHGKKICKTTPTVTEAFIRQFLADAGLNDIVALRQIKAVMVHTDGQFEIRHLEQEMTCDF